MARSMAGTYLAKGSPFTTAAKLTQVTYSAVTQAPTFQDTVQVLCARNVMSQNLPVAWGEVGDSLQELDKNRRPLTIKPLTGEAPLGKCMKQWGLQMSDKCSSCGESEDVPHCWQCPSEDRCQISRWHLRELRRWMQQCPMRPEVATSLSSILRNQPEALAYLRTTGPSSSLHKATQQQAAIGLQAFQKGLIAPQWEPMQRIFLQQQQSRWLAMKRAQQLMRRSWRIAWEQWTAQNEAVFEGQDSAEAGMIQALHDRAGPLRLRLKQDYINHGRLIQTASAADATTAQVAVWVEQAARALHEPVATGAL